MIHYFDHRILQKDISNRWAFFVALFFSFLLVDYLFSLRFFSGNSVAFDTHDPALHVGGWWLYQADRWHFPILNSVYQDAVEGGFNVAFTDGIPLVAVFFKLIKSYLPAHFHYFGWWYAFVFITQAISSVFLLRILGARSLLSALSALVFACTWPVLTRRLGHMALMTHSLILVALMLYFYIKNLAFNIYNSNYKNLLNNKDITSINNTVNKLYFKKINFLLWLMVLLCIVSFLIHPYFVPMVWGIFFVTCLDTYRLNLRAQLPFFVGLFISFFIVAYVGGYFGHPTGAGGYGMLPLNLTAPFCGGGAILKCEYGLSLAAWEGNNYFGFGLLLLLPLALFLERKKIFPFIKNNPFLIFYFVAITLFAITDFIHIGPYIFEFFKYPLWFLKIASIFRASGRLFWPVGYFILFITLAVLWKKQKQIPVLALVIIVASVLQVIDVKPYLVSMRNLAHTKSNVNYKSWEKIMQKVTHIDVHPAHLCPPHSTLAFFTVARQTAGYYSKMLNSGPSARDVPNCPLREQAFKQAPIEGHLYVLEYQNFNAYPLDNTVKMPPLFQTMLANGECATTASALHLICLTGIKSQKQWHDFDQSFTKIEPVLPNILHRSGAALVSNPPAIADKEIIKTQVSRSKGSFAYSPFGVMPQGHYRVEVEYASAEPSENSVLDIVAWQKAVNEEPKNGTMLGKSVAMGTNDQWQTVGFEMDVTYKPQTLQQPDPVSGIVIDYVGTSEVRIRHLTISKL